MPTNLLVFSVLFEQWADECDDIMDHDELHAAAMVASTFWAREITPHSYVVRWLEGLYTREQAIRERENRGN